MTMTKEEIREIVRQVSKGSYQLQVAADMFSTSGARLPALTLKGKAKSYMGKYQQSFDIVKNRLQELGLELEYIPGERGGLTTGWWKVKQ